MFEESLVESTPLLRTRTRGPLLTSFAVQAALAAALIAIPMLHPEIIHLQAPRITLVAPPLLRPTPPPPPPVHVAASTSPTPAPASAQPTVATSIRAMFRDLSGVSPIDTPALTSVNIGSGNPNLPPGVATAPAGPHVSVTPAAATHAGPLNISSGVTAGLLMSPIQPVYPAIAKAAHVSGTVVVQAIISTTGHIESAHAVSGPEMLRGAALEAVENARYRPYLLNNQPTTVETTITINFQLGS